MVCSAAAFWAAAQLGPRVTAWKEVDDAIQKGLPKTAIEKLDPIIRDALRDRAYPEAVRAIARNIVLEGNIQGNKPEEKITRMQAELDHLWRVLRPQVTAAVTAAAAQGDRSENAEYIYGKKQLREIDRRVRHLRKRLENMVIVDQTPSDPSRIFFGAWVRVEDDAGVVRVLRIVGPDEFDMDPDFISMDSPLGRALLRKGINDEVTVPLPAGERTFVVLDVRYGERPLLTSRGRS